MPEPERKDRNDAANRLADSSNPYLRQHADDPVDWYPWGEEAIERAREEEKPILLSIGYSTCHWCHVMQRKCFRDPEIAELMNRNFINVTVDREERPDLDQLYMRAVQLMAGRGGWPLTVFLTGELKPFYGGTYFPPEDRGETPGFPSVLRSVKETWEERREEVNSKVAGLVEDIEEGFALPSSEEPVRQDLLDETLTSVVSNFDMRTGGFGTGAKFPQAALLDWLLGLWHEEREDRAALIVKTSLNHMAAGGIFDHVGGGFHRYAVDRAWRIPHFEKLLYDTAQLTGLYADASRAFGNRNYRATAQAGADYLLRTLRSPEGAFFSAQDADTPEGEGVYYAWRREEIFDCLESEDAELVAEHFGITEEGNWEDGLNVLYEAVPLSELEGVGQEEARRIVRRSLEALRERRQQRQAPAVDHKVLTDWNGLAVSGLTRLYRAAEETPERYLEAAREAAEFLWEELRHDDRLWHTWQEGRGRVEGFLSDYAMLAAGLLDLYDVTLDTRYLRWSWPLAATILSEFWDAGDGVFHECGPENEKLIASADKLSDEPVPSGASTACHVFFRLAGLGHGDRYLKVAEEAINNAAGVMRSSALATGHMLAAAMRHLSESRELVIVGPETEVFRRVSDEFYLPYLLTLAAGPEEVSGLAGEVDLLEGKVAEEGTTAFLCTAGACRAPVDSPEALREQLREVVGEA